MSSALPAGWIRLVALCLVGCAAQSAAPLSARAPVDPRAAQPQAASVDDAVRLAVFRYLMSHNASAGQAGVPFVCLEVHHGDQVRDPSPFIMAAMSGSKTLVVPGSACQHSAQGVLLRGDGGGLVFRTEKVEIDGDKATVTGGYFEADLSASGNVYTVERQGDGSWLVTDDRMEWIS
jgi:hypothetical protein